MLVHGYAIERCAAPVKCRRLVERCPCMQKDVTAPVEGCLAPAELLAQGGEANGLDYIAWRCCAAAGVSQKPGEYECGARIITTFRH